MSDEGQSPPTPENPQKGSWTNPATVLLGATVAAVMLWTFQQRWVEDEYSQDSPPGDSPKVEQPVAHPASGELHRLFSDRDYPAKSQALGEEGTVKAEVDVDSTGRVADCRIVESSGSERLDSATCKLVKRRARFKPATDADGNPVDDTVQLPPISWRLE